MTFEEVSTVAEATPGDEQGTAWGIVNLSTEDIGEVTSLGQYPVRSEGIQWLRRKVEPAISI